MVTSSVFTKAKCFGEFYTLTWLFCCKCPIVFYVLCLGSILCFACFYSLTTAETSSPHTNSSQNGLLVSSTAGGNLMLYMPEECNSTTKTEAVTMEDHSTFNPNSPEAASPMSTTCSTSSSAYSPSSPSVSIGVPSPSCTSRENDLMLFDEDTISSLASILEEANEERTSSQRTLKCPRTSITQTCHSPEAQVPVSPRTTNQQQSVFNFGQATSSTQFIETNFNAVTDIVNQNTRTSTRSKTKRSATTHRYVHERSLYIFMNAVSWLQLNVDIKWNGPKSMV